MVAAAAGHFDAFRILLEKNSAIDDVDQERQTVLHLAARENHISILEVHTCGSSGSKDALFSLNFVSSLHAYSPFLPVDHI